jgi:phage I-like protein
MYGHPLATHAQAAALAPQAEEAGLALQFQSGAVPEWIEMIPAGRIQGRDGRQFVNDQPNHVVAAFRANRASLPIDIEHSSQHKATVGEPAPAQAWIEDLDVRNGAIWARVEWNEAGRKLVANREYRYYSPVFYASKANNQVLALKSAGLTNQPNLYFPALNAQENPANEENAMTPKAILQALSLADTATEADVVTAINTLKADHTMALNQAQHPDEKKFIPAATHELVLNRATAAEAALADRDAKQREKDIEVAVNAAADEKKILPGKKDYYIAQCRKENGLEDFVEFAKTAPKVVADDTNLGKKPGHQALNVGGYKAPAGYEVDPQRADLHAKAVAHQQEHKCSYADAAIAVGA